MKILGEECSITKTEGGFYLLSKNKLPYTTSKVDIHELAERSGLASSNSRSGIFPWFPSRENLIKFIDFVNTINLEHWKSWYKEMTGKDI